MSDVAAPPGMLRPPSERPAGRRGPRGPAAAVAALAGLIPLGWARVADETSWARPTLFVAGGALVAAALLLWTTRRRTVVAAGVALVVLGGVATVVAIRADSRAESRRMHWEERLGGAVFDDPRVNTPRLTRAEAEAVPTGLTRKQLRARLGTPASYGIQRVSDGRDMRCWAYLGPRNRKRPPGWSTLHAFCFRHGRYAELSEW